MENYEDLLRRKYLIGTPKEQFEYVDNLSKSKAKISAALINSNTIIESLLEADDTAPIGHFKTMLQIILEINTKAINGKI